MKSASRSVIRAPVVARAATVVGSVMIVPSHAKDAARDAMVVIPPAARFGRCGWLGPSKPGELRGGTHAAGQGRGREGQGCAGRAGHDQRAGPGAGRGGGEGPGLRGLPHRPALPRGRDQRRLPVPAGPRGLGRGRGGRPGRDRSGAGRLRGPQLARRVRRLPGLQPGRAVVLLRDVQRDPEDDARGRHRALPGPGDRRLRREDPGRRRPVHQGRPGRPAGGGRAARLRRDGRHRGSDQHRRTSAAASPSR